MQAEESPRRWKGELNETTGRLHSVPSPTSAFHTPNLPSAHIVIIISMSFAAEQQSGNSVAEYQTLFNSIATSASAVHFAVSSTSSGSDTCSLYDDTIRLHPPHRRMEANARERDRTCNLNTAYKRLRDMIPTEPQNRKLSKIEILRLAKSYIEHLQNVRCARQRGDFSQNPCARINFTRNVCTFCLTSCKRRN